MKDNAMKYRFEITYQTEYMMKASEWLRQMDLGTGEFAFQEVIEFNGKDLEVSYVKEKLKWAFDSAGFKLFKIEGGKIE